MSVGVVVGSGEEVGVACASFVGIAVWVAVSTIVSTGEVLQELNNTPSNMIMTSQLLYFFIALAFVYDYLDYNLCSIN
jgi:hypothetical protein